MTTTSLPVRRPTFQRIRIGDVIRFRYHGTIRRLRVEKFTDSYVQGENLMVDGNCPERQYSTYTFAKMEENASGMPGVFIES